MLPPKMMKASVLIGPYQLEMKEVPVPELEEEDVLVEVLACGICTTDIELYDGSQPYLHKGITSLPLTLGHEWCGQVAAMGSKVKGFTLGEKVVGDVSIGCGKCYNCMQGNYHICTHRREIGVINYNGAFAEYLKVPYKNLYPIGEKVSPLTAMFVEPAATSVRALMRTGIHFGDRVVVYGDGTIGIFAAQAALAMGASRVAIVARKNLNKDLFLSWGMDFINNTETTVGEAVKNMWGCDKVEVTVECTGNTAIINDAIHLTAPGGTVFPLSFSGKLVEIDIDDIVCRDLLLVGSVASPNAFVPTMRMMAEGKIHVDGMLSAKFTQDQIPEAFEFVKQRKGPRIKVGVVKSLDIK